MKCLVKAHDLTGVISVQNINLLHFIKNPSNKPKKELPLWRFVTLNEGAPLRANQEEYDQISTLILEFDKAVFIPDIEALASEYAYAIHTTSGHTKEAHRFRLMLPLDISYPESFWRTDDIKEAMAHKFPGFDPTTFSNYQKIPALPANPEDYYYKIHSGRKFGYQEVKEIVESIEMNREFDRRFNESLKPKKVFLESESINYEAYKAKVDASADSLIASLPKYENKSRYTEFIRAMGKLLGKRYPDGEYVYMVSEIEHMLRRVYWDGELAKALRSFARKRK